MVSKITNLGDLGELLHVHAILEMTLALLRFRFAITSSVFLDQITSLHVLMQLRGLDSALLQSS